MTHMRLLVLVLVTSLLGVDHVCAKIESPDALNTTDAYVFSHDHREIYLPNLRRTKDPSARLKFIIPNATVNKVYDYWGTKWGWVLSDNYVSIFSREKIDEHNITKYTLQIPGTGHYREACIHYGYRNASWYNAYQSQTPSWPMDLSRSLPTVEFNNIRNYSDDGQKNNEFYLILEQLFVNTDGFAVALEQDEPLFIRRDPNHGDALLCFSSDTLPPYDIKAISKQYRSLTLYFFAGKNIRTVTDYVINHSGLIGKPTAIPDTAKFTYPTWSDYLPAGVPSANETTIEDIARDISAHNFSTHSELLIDDYSQAEFGDAALDSTKYPNATKMIEQLQGKGFQIGLGITPSIHKYHKDPKHIDNFTARYFIKDFHNNTPTVLVDFSNPEGADWFEYLLRTMKYNNGIDSFQLNPVHISELVKFYDSQAKRAPALISKLYVETAARLGNKVVSSIGYKTQHLPNFVRLNFQKQPFDAEEMLHSLIPNALSVSLAGYPFIEPYPIRAFINESTMLTAELYIRQVQAVTFMPSISFRHPPWVYNNETVTKLTKHFIDLHQAHAATFIELAKERVHRGSPIIRPLWYLSPEDAVSFTVNDQFLCGDDILVAPVLKAGQRQRNVYLPAGVWVDSHGAKNTGPGTVKVKAPLEELPYFKRQIVP